MGILIKGLDVISANMAGSALPSKIAIGESGLAFASGQSGLGIETDRNSIINTDLSTSAQVTFISNFSPVEMSGTIFREFGTYTSGDGAAVLIDRQVLTGSLVFDGEQELQIQESFSFFISGT